MKVRNGFVSNSSSSSFILGLGTVKDLDAVKKYIADNNLESESDFYIGTAKELQEKHPWDVKIKGTRIEVESFLDSMSQEICSDDQVFVAYSFAGGEGDWAFIDNCDYGDIDYDIDLDFFDAKQKDLYSLFNNKELVDGYAYYGAARDG